MPYITIIIAIVVIGAVYAVLKSTSKQADREEGTKGFNYIQALICEHEEHQTLLSDKAYANEDHTFNRVHNIRITQFDAPFNIKEEEDVYPFVAPHIKSQIVRDYLKTYCKRKEWTYRESKNDFEGVVIEINTYVSCAIC